MVKPGKWLESDDTFEYDGNDTMSIELAADGVKMVFKPFKVFLGRYVWEKLIEHVLEVNGEDDETCGCWFCS